MPERGANPAEPLPPERELQSLRRSLLRWFDCSKRDLPWRRTRDPYRIWLSECMLQQTRVETVIPYYQRFLAAFPTATALADASLQRVLKLWAGLGYYARARNLHRAAQIIATQHAGHVPESAAALAELPGVGRYTAAAVASIAFGEPVAAVDGNIQRVLARLLAVTAPIDAAATRTRLWSLAETLLDRKRPGAFNEALMELGATLCTPTAPRCHECPLAKWCVAHRSGRTADLPVKARRSAPTTLRIEAIAIRRDARLLLLQRPPSGLYGGMWELPSLATDSHAGEGTTAPRLSAFASDHHGITIETPRCVGTVTHVLTHRRMLVRVWIAGFRSGRARRGSHAAARWISRPGRADLPIAVLDRRTLELAESTK
ncbi:MAG: A/G-specific adenine glycosylase [Phycisphaerales bacterium]|nr:A/G-specific adenine glycosylase [Phycisphaerales bacterium]